VQLSGRGPGGVAFGDLPVDDRFQLVGQLNLQNLAREALLPRRKAK
jgi:hypothetical protein